jgi:hypothetical protein
VAGGTGVWVPIEAEGTAHRNHCPSCPLEPSLDDSPGHRCTGCGVVHLNRTAGDDNVYVLIQLVTRPLAHPAFPLDVLGRL